MTPEEALALDLMDRCQRERDLLGDCAFPVEINVDAAIELIGQLQVALRHPANKGDSANTARQLINGLAEQMRRAGYLAHAELIERGYDGRFDS